MVESTGWVETPILRTALRVSENHTRSPYRCPSTSTRRLSHHARVSATGISGRLRTESVGWLGLPGRSHEPVLRPARCGVRERTRARSAPCHWEGPVRDRSLTWTRRRVVPPPSLSSQGRVDVVDDCGRIHWIGKANRHESLAPARMGSHVWARVQPLGVRGPNRGTDRSGGTADEVLCNVARSMPPVSPPGCPPPGIRKAVTPTPSATTTPPATTCHTRLEETRESGVADIAEDATPVI